MDFLLIITCCLLCLSACKSKKTDVTSLTEAKNHLDSLPKFSEKNTLFNDNQSQDDTIYRIVESLPEVKSFSKKYDLKKLNKKMTILIAVRPDTAFNYYWVQAGASDDDRFQPVYNFYISKESLEINFYDTVSDSLVSLKQWRVNRGW